METLETWTNRVEGETEEDLQMVLRIGPLAQMVFEKRFKSSDRVWSADVQDENLAANG